MRVVDDKAAAVVSMYASDESGEEVSMTENGDMRVWMLTTEVTTPYTGSYSAQYMQEGSSSFTPSGYSVPPVQLGSEPAPVIATPTPTAAPTDVPVTATPAPIITATPTALRISAGLWP